MEHRDRKVIFKNVTPNSKGSRAYSDVRADGGKVADQGPRGTARQKCTLASLVTGWRRLFVNKASGGHRGGGAGPGDPRGITAT